MEKWLLLPALLALLALALPARGGARGLQALRVSENRRFLQQADGTPFFYLGDTAWELFHRLNREEAAHYLQDRARRGFTVVQAVALAELDGHTVPNAYGHLPLLDLDPARPAVREGEGNDYWDHVDWIVREANRRGLRVGLLPTWGRYWHDAVRDGRPLFTRANASAYGEWLGRRYRAAGIIWIVGGDRRVENDEQRAVVEALALGLRRGDGGAHLITFHPPGGAGSSEWFHDAPWLDFNMRQNGHQVEFTGRYDATRADYDRVPVKPVLDGEPVYEDHPVSFRAPQLGHTVAADVRRPLYWDLFSGACGHTYGHHSVWQMASARHEPVNAPLLDWRAALAQPGAAQMVHGRRLMESRPFFTRVPDDGLIVPHRFPTAVPGAGRYRFCATRDEAGTYAMVYAPVSRPFTVRTGALAGRRLVGWWFDPRTGRARRIGEWAREAEREFRPPDPGEERDWVLVIDDASRGYLPPGRL